MPVVPSEFDWAKFLLLADELSQRTEEEALRTAVGRAYYAAFHAAKLALSVKVPLKYTGPGHSKFWEENYQLALDSRHKQIGTDGDRLRSSRHHADYVADARNWQRLATQVLSQAKNLIEEIEALPRLPYAGAT